MHEYNGSPLSPDNNAYVSIIVQAALAIIVLIQWSSEKSCVVKAEVKLSTLTLLNVKTFGATIWALISILSVGSVKSNTVEANYLDY